jgi:hypothetical protein
MHPVVEKPLSNGYAMLKKVLLGFKNLKIPGCYNELQRGVETRWLEGLSGFLPGCKGDWGIGGLGDWGIGGLGIGGLGDWGIGGLEGLRD